MCLIHNTSAGKFRYFFNVITGRKQAAFNGCCYCSLSGVPEQYEQDYGFRSATTAATSPQQDPPHCRNVWAVLSKDLLRAETCWSNTVLTNIREHSSDCVWDSSKYTTTPSFPLRNLEIKLRKFRKCSKNNNTIYTLVIINAFTGTVSEKVQCYSMPYQSLFART